MGPLGMAAAQGAINLGSSFIGNVMGQQNAEKQFENQKGLMRLGMEQQKELWNYTNYENQVEHLKAAGLNPALLYGKGGAGGATTGSGGGGQAAMAPTPGIMGPQIMDIKQQMANIKVQESQADLNAATAEKLRGIDTRKGEQDILESGSRIALNTATIGNIEAKTDVEKINKQIGDWELYLKGKSADDILDQIHTDVLNSQETLKRNLWQNKLNDAQYENLLKELKNKVRQQGIDYLISAKEYSQMDDRWAAEQKQILTGLKQKWRELEISGQNAGTQAGRLTMEKDIQQSELDNELKNDIIELLSFGFINTRKRTTRNVSIGPKGRTTSHTTTE